jgi:hypothetical protein
MGKLAWNREMKTNSLKIYRKKDVSVVSNYTVKVIVNLPGINKQIAFKAVSDIH